MQKSLFREIFITKENPTQVVSCEFCEIFKNTIFYRTPPVAASVFMKLIFDFLQNLDPQSCYTQIGNNSKVTLKIRTPTVKPIFLVRIKKVLLVLEVDVLLEPWQ